MKAEYQNQSVQRAMMIMDEIGRSEQGLSLAELSKRTGLHKSIAYRILITLESGGWLQRNPQSSRYHVGIKLLSLSSYALDNISVKEMITPYMRQLAAATGETVVLVMYSDHQAICVEKIESENSVRISAQLGKSFPLHAGATGLSVLMGMPDEMVGQILQTVQLKRYSSATITDPQKIRALIEHARADGYITSAGTVDLDVFAVGMSISFPQEQLYLGLSVIGPQYRFTDEKTARVIKELLTVKRQLIAE